jgi:hypothetical protein
LPTAEAAKGDGSIQSDSILAAHTGKPGFENCLEGRDGTQYKQTPRIAFMTTTRYPHSHAWASDLLSQTILAYAKSICPEANLNRVARIESDHVLFRDDKGRKVAAPYIAFNRAHIGFKSFIREKVSGRGFTWLGNGQASRNGVEIAFYGEAIALENALGDE